MNHWLLARKPRFSHSKKNSIFFLCFLFEKIWVKNYRNIGIYLKTREIPPLTHFWRKTLNFRCFSLWKKTLVISILESKNAISWVLISKPGDFVPLRGKKCGFFAIWVAKPPPCQDQKFRNLRPHFSEGGKRDLRGNRGVSRETFGFIRLKGKSIFHLVLLMCYADIAKMTRAMFGCVSVEFGNQVKNLLYVDFYIHFGSKIGKSSHCFVFGM